MPSDCHSEQSEESLFAEKPEKERFLTPQTPFGMTNSSFSRTVEAANAFLHETHAIGVTAMAAEKTRCDTR